jgi:predicted O-methyltransferase YrrM
MSEKYYTTGKKNGDPWDSLGDMEWVEKQLEYARDENNVSGKGLVPYIKQLSGDSLVGCEVGVCHGVTTQYLLKNVENISKLYAVDPYPTFVDWNGTRLTEGRQKITKDLCFERLQPFSDRIEFVYESSVDFAPKLKDGYLDFIFIDGDHSYDAVLRDCHAYWPKVKEGGLFAGHDINLASVQQALQVFFSSLDKKFTIAVVENNAWFLIK